MLKFLLSSHNDETIQNHQEPETTNSVKTFIQVGTDTLYNSPWDINNRVPVGYFLESSGLNNTTIVRITPYIGLAYYDGADDGTYNTAAGAINLASGAYPNLYANGHEYGNYVQGNPIVMKNHVSFQSHELMIFSPEDHCPLVNVNIGYNFNLAATRFNIINNDIVQPAPVFGYTITPPPPAGTISEQRLLLEYGKVMYYKMEFSTSTTVFTGTPHYALTLEVPNVSDPFGDWASIPGPIPTIPLTDSFGGHIYYHTGTGTGSTPTSEIVIDLGSVTVANFQTSGNAFPTSTGSHMFQTTGQNFWGWGFPPSTPADHVHIRFYY